jgi:hypothetical protein
MTMLTWFARVLQPDGTAAKGLVVEVHVFNLARGEWQLRGEGEVGADGNVRGRIELPGAELAGDSIELAPAVRLIESSATPAVLSAAPRLSLTKRPVALAVDFGEITRVGEAERFVPPRAAIRGVPDEQLLMGGVTLPPALRADIGAVFARARTDGPAGRDTPVTRDRVPGGDVTPIPTRDVTPTVDRTTGIDAPDLVALRSERDELTRERTALLSTRAALVAERATLASELDTLRGEREAMATRLGEREEEARKLRTELADARLELAGRDRATAGAPTMTDGTVSVSEFAIRLGSEIDSARTALKRSAMSLGDISITTRALVDSGGSRLKLLNADELKGTAPGLLADVNLNYRPDKGGDTAPTGVQVPDVRQLTEGAARRVLASVGLMLDASQGARELAPESAIGQAMLQQPKPGERVAVGARVLVVFARADTPRDNR